MTTVYSPTPDLSVEDSLRRESPPPFDKSSASSLVEYDQSFAASTPQTEIRAKTVRHGKDYRPESTFWKKPRSEQTYAMRVCDIATCADEVYVIHEKDRGPIPRQSILKDNVYILSRALIPSVLQTLSYWLFPQFKWPLALAYPVYFVSFNAFAIKTMWRLNDYCVKYGTFDEKNFGRDRTPDKAVNGLAKAVLLYMVLRTAIPFSLHYDKDVTPLFSFNRSFPLRLIAWELTLDYFFYVYHRACHEVDFLWFIHRHHHTTKHPTPILAILAEDYQECLEIVIIPLTASLLVPMSFSELYVTMCYTIFVEMLGHSGIRAFWSHPILFFLRLFDMDLTVEDHDLHHLFGKSGRNYGKQSRVWDKLFGTVAERVETYSM